MPEVPPFRREKYSTWNWSYQVVVGRVGQLLSDAASFVPLPEAASARLVAALKASLSAGGFLSGPPPFISQLEGVPGGLGAVTDILERLIREGFGSGEEALAEALFELGVLDRGQKGAHAGFVLPVWLVDP